MAGDQPDGVSIFSLPMPTAEGDVVVRHLTNVYEVWLVEMDGAQEPDDITRTTCWTADEAERIAMAFAEAGGRIFRLHPDGGWSEQQNPQREVV